MASSFDGVLDEIKDDSVKAAKDQLQSLLQQAKADSSAFARKNAASLEEWIVELSNVRNLAKSIGEDIYKRPYITVGFTALTTMVPLAMTSTAGMIRRLGGRRWNQLHRLIYLTGVLAVIHYWWLVKADIRRPLAYGVIVGSLLLFRLWWAKGRVKSPARPALERAPAR